MRQGIWISEARYVLGNSQYVLPSFVSLEPVHVVGGEVPVEEEIVEGTIIPDLNQQDKISEAIESRVVKLSGRGLKVY